MTGVASTGYSRIGKEETQKGELVVLLSGDCSKCAYCESRGRFSRLRETEMNTAGTGYAEAPISRRCCFQPGWPAKPLLVAAAYPAEALQMASGHLIQH